MSTPGERWTIDRLSLNTGKSPVQTFLASLVDRNRVEAPAFLRRLEGHGNRLRPPQSKPLDEELFELRGHQVRIFYVFRPSCSTGS
jgi:hypothetical protein